MSAATMTPRPQSSLGLRFIALAGVLITLPGLIAAEVLVPNSWGLQFVADLQNNNRTALGFLYDKVPRGLIKGRSTPISMTVEGCRFYRGSNYAPIETELSLNALTTWVLPLAGGLILQAPFESNKIFSTLMVLCRWLGSPITSLMCILWNMKITGQCALLVDMAVARDTTPGYTGRPPRDRRNRIRRGLWLKFMGGGSVGVPRREQDDAVEAKVSEREVDEPETWDERMNRLPSEEKRNEANAFAELRDSLYILSVLNQFGFRHDQSRTKALLQYALLSRTDPNNVTHRRELAATLRRERRHGVVQVLVSLMWFLVALIISIFQAFGKLGDNSTAHNLAIGLLMSWLPMQISCSLVDRNSSNTEHTKTQLQTFLNDANRRRPPGEQSDDARLTEYCGQARVKWHYGIAHSILIELEHHLECRERGLLRFYIDGSMARTGAIERHHTGGEGEVGAGAGAENSPQDSALWRFDVREGWQMILACFIFCCSATGAFLISYRTPTVGLGCRSGGYMNFAILSLSNFVFELIGWRLLNPYDAKHNKKLLHFIHLFVTITEVVNTGWLVYIIVASTLGLYNSCDCKASIWGPGGQKDGYIVFVKDYLSFRQEFDITRFWITGTIIGCLPLVLVLYAVYQWCTQSFLWTQDYDKAMRGLQRVRRVKRVVQVEKLHRLFINGPNRIWKMVWKGNHPNRHHHHSVTWRP